MISSRALAALAIATTCLILAPRASGGGASNGGFTNPFVSVSAFGMVHPGGDACSTSGFASSQATASRAYRRPTPATRHVGIGSRGTPRASTARTRAGRACLKSARVTGSVTWKNGGPSSFCHFCEMKFHTGGV